MLEEMNKTFLISTIRQWTVQKVAPPHPFLKTVAQRSETPTLLTKVCDPESPLDIPKWLVATKSCRQELVDRDCTPVIAQRDHRFAKPVSSWPKVAPSTSPHCRIPVTFDR